MINKKHLIFAFLVFFIFAFKVNAGLEINEVNYNPPVKTDHLWIKVYNNTSNSINLTGWTVADLDSDNKWHYHAINAYNSELIEPNSYAFIAKASASSIISFIEKNPDINGQLYYGNLTINSEGIIGLSLDKKTVISQFNYGGNSDDSGGIDNNDDGGTDFGSSISTSTDKEILPPLKITTKINIPKVIVAGDPFTFSSITTTNRKEIYKVGRFLWNFGDGMVIWTKESGPFEYTYEYPGEYVLTLSYFDNSFTEIPDATDRIVVKVIDSGLSVSSVGTLYDPYIEMVNNSSSEIDLSGWKIIAGSHTFNFPNGTSILSKKKIKLSPKITGFTGDDIKNVIILNPNGEMVSMYPLVKRSVYKSNISSITNTSNNNYNKEDLKESDNIINLDNLGASASTPTSKIPDYIYPIITLVLIIAIGIVSFLMFQNKNKKNEDLESSINSDDIKIIE